MNMLDWLILGVTEIAKYILFSYGILGFQARKGKAKYFCFLYLLAGGLLTWYYDGDSLIFQTTWGAVIVFSFFKGQLKKKIQAVLIEYSAISAVDMMIGSIVWMVWSQEQMQGTAVLTHITNVIGVGVWIVGCVFLNRVRSDIQRSFNQLEGRYFFVIELLLLGFVLMATNAQASVMGGITEKMRNISFVISTISTILIMIVCVIFMRTLYLKKQFQLVNQYNEKYFDYQKSYYEKLMVKDEEAKKFRHDIRKHINILSVLYCY